MHFSRSFKDPRHGFLRLTLHCSAFTGHAYGINVLAQVSNSITHLSSLIDFVLLWHVEVEWNKIRKEQNLEGGCKH